MSADAAHLRQLVSGRIGPLSSEWSKGRGVHPIESWAHALPDGGLPRGAVVEIAAHGSLGQGTALALALCAEVQGAGRGDAPFCAWIDPEHTLYAPAVDASGALLDRLLVVRPERRDLAKTAVRLVASRLF